MTSYCTPEPVDPERLVLIRSRGETPEQRAQTKRTAEQQAIKQARKARKQKLKRKANYNLGDTI